MKSASGPEWQESFIQNLEGGELFIKSGIYSGCLGAK
jgi:hypothetical protein